MYVDENGEETQFAAPRYYCPLGDGKSIRQTCENEDLSFTCPIEFACAKMFKRDYLDYNGTPSNMSFAVQRRLMADTTNQLSYNVCAGGATKEECEIYCKTECLKIEKGAKVTYESANESATDTMYFYCPDKSEIRNTSYTETYCPSYMQSMNSSVITQLDVFCENQVDCVEVQEESFTDCDTTTKKCNGSDVSSLFWNMSKQYDSKIYNPLYTCAVGFTREECMRHCDGTCEYLVGNYYLSDSKREIKATGTYLYACKRGQ